MVLYGDETEDFKIKTPGSYKTIPEVLLIESAVMKRHVKKKKKKTNGPTVRLFA